MGDALFVCHHVAALYAYGYVLVSVGGKGCGSGVSVTGWGRGKGAAGCWSGVRGTFQPVGGCGLGARGTGSWRGWAGADGVLHLQNRGVLPYFANFRLLSELSTPFVNLR